MDYMLFRGLLFFKKFIMPHFIVCLYVKCKPLQLLKFVLYAYFFNLVDLSIPVNMLTCFPDNLVKIIKKLKVFSFILRINEI